MRQLSPRVSGRPCRALDLVIPGHDPLLLRRLSARGGLVRGHGVPGLSHRAQPAVIGLLPQGDLLGHLPVVFFVLSFGFLAHRLFVRAGWLLCGGRCGQGCPRRDVLGHCIRDVPA